MTPAEMNKINGELLKRNSPLMHLKLPVATGAFGGTSRIKLNNTGLITRLFAHFKIPYNATVAPTSIGNKGVLAAIPRIQLNDFDGSKRINTSAFHLSVVNAIRGRNVFSGMSNAAAQNTYTPVQAGFSNDYKQPAVSVSGTGAQTIEFVLEIPVCAHVEKGDLRGMLAAQYTSGDIQLEIDFAALLNGTTDDDLVFNGGTMTLPSAPTVTVYQEYYMPQMVRGVNPIPQDDISQVYEIGVYSRTTDNLAIAQEKLINFPTIREVNSVVFNFISNKLLGGGSSANDITNIKLRANGSNLLLDHDRYFQCDRQRASLGEDLPQGTYFLDFANGPITTAMYANVQMALTPGSATNPAVEVTFESIYAKGASMTGAPV